MSAILASQFDQALDDAFEEGVRAQDHHGGMNSPHEGYAIILEELDELWDHVKGNTCNTPEAYKEAIQVAASAARFAATFGRR